MLCLVWVNIINHSINDSKAISIMCLAVTCFIYKMVISGSIVVEHSYTCHKIQAANTQFPEKKEYCETCLNTNFNYSINELPQISMTKVKKLT